MARFSMPQSSSGAFSLSLFASYIVDWIIIIGIAAVGAGFWKQTPYHRPFSPVNPEISYPYKESSTVPTYALALAALLGPALITAILALALPASPLQSSLSLLKSPRGRSLMGRLWEWNTAWMGLGLALAVTFMFTEGMKNVFGKPRPDLLARCDLDPNLVAGGSNAVGGFGVRLPEWNLLVSSAACRQPDKSVLDDGFESFPSGHASFSWAGLFYLSLWLASRLQCTIPYILPYSFTSTSSNALSPTPYRNQAAAPPTYTIIFPLVPVCVATYIASTRYTDFRHHGFDIIFGSLMGILFSWLAFRYYHLPIRRGGGGSWAPRGTRNAWIVSRPGKGGVGGEGWGEHEDEVGRKRRDEEEGTANVNGLNGSRDALAGANGPTPTR